MDNDTLDKIYKEIQTNAARVKENQRYVSGDNPFIMGKEPGNYPDHRIPMAHAKVAVDDMTGYAGRAGDRVAEYGLASKDVEADNDNFIAFMRSMDAHNDEKIETSELYEEGCSQGVGYEIWYTSTKVSGYPLTAEFKIVPTQSIYIDWSDDIKPIMNWFAYLNGDDKEKTISIYYPLVMEQFTSIDGGKWSAGKVTKYPYTTPPLNIFAINREQMPIFQAGKPQINAYDLLLSNAINEADRFNSLIPILGDQTTEQFRDDFRKGKVDVIDDQADSERTDLPKYLQKDYSGITEFCKELWERFDEDFRRVTKIPDMGGEKFGDSQSGRAMAYKLMIIEFIASKIDIYFNKGMIQRLQFYADVYNAGSQKVNVSDYKATVTAKRNIPVDVQAIAEVINLIRGDISKRTLLNYLPNQIVDDVEKELERLKEEQPQDVLGINEGPANDVTGT